jgi:hypothetical protein
MKQVKRSKLVIHAVAKKLMPVQMISIADQSGTYLKIGFFYEEINE